MTKILQCPACGANEDYLIIEQSAVIEYRPTYDEQAPDSVRLEEVDVHTHKDWRMICGSCGFDEEGEDFTAPFILEVEEE